MVSHVEALSAILLRASMAAIAAALSILWSAAAMAHGPQEYAVEHYRVVDGDTVSVTLRLLDLGATTLTATILLRIHGIDAPELRAQSACERALAQAARDYASVWISAHASGLRAVVIGADKYGRALGDLRVGDLSLGRAMLDAGYARPYPAPDRPPWCGT